MLKVLSQVRLRSPTNVPVCITKRLKHKKKFKKEPDVKTYVSQALSHYDFHIGKKMDKMWPRVRLALLSQAKYCAVLNRFCDNYEQTLRDFAEGGGFDFLSHRRDLSECTGKYSIVKQEEEKRSTDEDSFKVPQPNSLMTSSESDLNYFMPSTRIYSELERMTKEEAEMYNAEPPKDPGLVVEKPYSSPFLSFAVPHMLKAVIYGKGDVTRFKPASRDPVTGKLNYYLMDAGSILPVLALDLEPDCSVLDLCAAPGGKTHAILQTMLPGSLTCTDSSYSRVLRLKDVIGDYLPQSFLDEGKVMVKHKDAVDYGHENPNQYDRVLVDVPCFADRYSVTEMDNNLFKPSRQGDRLIIQQKQQALLLSAIRACKPGGIIVYSTCTLLPPQNDGTIRGALDYIHSHTGMQVVVVDTGYLAESFDDHFVFNQNPLFGNLGQLALPNVTANFGPTYFCKLRRVK